ncbi:MAG: AmmeMemoRadiSam system radical SAM enzyme [Nitrospirae bacterium]|nr:AmmeMemoRadiSam system radical SAM enzyme [Nitrospirota bacterium]
MKEAMFYKKLKDGKVQCFLCAHHCVISDGRRGICGVRENKGGALYSLVYGKIISMNIDPIEKKPLFHFHPASKSFSIATVGCNFRCMHCQNYDISQYPKNSYKLKVKSYELKDKKNSDAENRIPDAKHEIPGEAVTPEEIVDAAIGAGCKSISYTYTEPTIFFEFAYDCAGIAHDKGIKNVFVSNGYTGVEAARAIAPYLDANNIDLKGDDKFYKKICGAKLQPVLDTIKLMEDSGVWVEITTLIIPGHNDSEETLRWIAGFIKSVDASIPWHVSQFYPTYKMLDTPRTPVETLRRARKIGFEAGLKYVYEGNVPGEGGENTHCPSCKELLIERLGFYIKENKMKDGACFNCKTKIEGVW